MKVRPSVKPICEKCKVIKRKGHVMVICENPRHDTKFIKPRLKRLKRFKPHYIVADKAYDSEKVRTFINETMDAFDIIPNKWTVKTGFYRQRSKYVFRKKV